MPNALLGTAVLASFLAGSVALFAPCCISVMLPAFFAGTFRQRTALTAMTLIFALGVAAVILPIAFGATAISRLINGQHALVWGVAGALMIAMGVAVLAGWSLPMPALRTRSAGNRSPGSVFLLGAFSGTASACCAPVLAGVIGLSAATDSFITALAVGLAYVFGMVVPLFIIALLWERYSWGESRLLNGVGVSLGWGRYRRRVAVATLVSGVLLIGIGAVVAVVAVTGPGMSSTGVLETISGELQHVAHLIVVTVGPGVAWLLAGAIFAGLVALVWRALRQLAPVSAPLPETVDLSVASPAARADPPPGPTQTSTLVHISEEPR